MSLAAELRRRIAALRIDDKVIAAQAGVHKDTLAKVLAGRCDPKISTLRNIEAALVAEERRVLAHLLALHPDLSPVAVPPLGLPVPAPAAHAAGAIYSNGRAA